MYNQTKSFWLNWCNFASISSKIICSTNLIPVNSVNRPLLYCLCSQDKSSNWCIKCYTACAMKCDYGFVSFSFIYKFRPVNFVIFLLFFVSSKQFVLPFLAKLLCTATNSIISGSIDHLIFHKKYKEKK